MLSDPVLVTIITVVVGGIFTAIFKVIDSKANQAKDELTKNTAEVDAVNKALEGMQVLANNLRTENDRERERADRESARADRESVRADREYDRAEELLKDLIEEKAINLALSRQKKESNDSG